MKFETKINIFIDCSVIIYFQDVTDGLVNRVIGTLHYVTRNKLIDKLQNIFMIYTFSSKWKYQVVWSVFVYNFSMISYL